MKRWIKGKGVGRADAQKERGGQRKERERGTLRWPHTRRYWARFWAQLVWATALSPTIVCPNTLQLCGVSTILYCSQSYPISKYLTYYDAIHMIPCRAVFAGNPAAASEREQTGKHQQFYIWSFWPFFLFFSGKTRHKPGRPAEDVDLPPYWFFHCKSSLIMLVSVRSHVCEINTLESLPQTAGVWYHVLDKLSRLCFRGIRLLWNRLRSVDSHVFLESVKTCLECG